MPVDDYTEPGMNLKVVYAHLAWEKRMKVFAAMHQLPSVDNSLPCASGSHYWIAFGGIFICRNCFSLQPIPVITCGYEYLLYSHNGRNKGGRKKEVKHAINRIA